MLNLAIGATVLGIVGIVCLRKLLGRIRDPSSPDAWTRAEVDAHLAGSGLYDREDLEEMGVYDDLLELAASGEVGDDETFERLCDAVVRRGGLEPSDDTLADADLEAVARPRRAHEAATQRTPPVDVGDVETLGVVDVERHHSGSRHAIGTVERFVVFVDGVPETVEAGDVVRAKVSHFNRGKTSATASFVEVVE